MSSFRISNQQSTLKYNPDLAEPKPLPSSQATSVMIPSQNNYLKTSANFPQIIPIRKKQIHPNFSQPTLLNNSPRFFYEKINNNINRDILPPKYEQVEYREETYSYKVLDPIRNKTIIKDPIIQNGSIKNVEYMKPVYKELEIKMCPEKIEVIKNKTIYQKYGDPLPDFSKMELNPSKIAKNFQEAQEIFKKVGLNNMELITPKNNINYNINPVIQNPTYNFQNENNNIIYTENYNYSKLNNNYLNQKYNDFNSKIEIRNYKGPFAKVTKLKKDIIIQNEPKSSIKQNYDSRKFFQKYTEKKQIKNENSGLFFPLTTPKILHSSFDELPLNITSPNDNQQDIVYHSMFVQPLYMRQNNNFPQNNNMNYFQQSHNNISNINENVIKKKYPLDDNIDYTSSINLNKEVNNFSNDSSQEEIAIHSAHTSEMSGDFGSSVKISKEKKIQFSNNKNL